MRVIKTHLVENWSSFIEILELFAKKKLCK